MYNMESDRHGMPNNSRFSTQTPQYNVAEAPACVQNAMMTKDKKPFTYTPGGIDLSQIKSQRMAKRLARNAQNEGTTGQNQLNRPTQSPQENSNINKSPVGSVLGATAMGMPFQVFPTGPPPPPPPPMKPSAPLSTSAPKNNSISPSRGNSTLSSSVPKNFDPPPIGFRPEIKIPPNPMAALKKVPTPQEKNNFWVEEYRKEHSKSPMRERDPNDNNGQLSPKQDQQQYNNNTVKSFVNSPQEESNENRKQLPALNQGYQSPNFNQDPRKQLPTLNQGYQSPSFNEDPRKQLPPLNQGYQSPSFNQDSMKQLPTLNQGYQSPGITQNPVKQLPVLNQGYQGPSFNQEQTKQLPVLNQGYQGTSFNQEPIKQSQPNQNKENQLYIQLAPNYRKQNSLQQQQVETPMSPQYHPQLEQQTETQQKSYQPVPWRTNKQVTPNLGNDYSNESEAKIRSKPEPTRMGIQSQEEKYPPYYGSRDGVDVTRQKNEPLYSKVQTQSPQHQQSPVNRADETFEPWPNTVKSSTPTHVFNNGVLKNSHDGLNFELFSQKPHAKEIIIPIQLEPSTPPAACGQQRPHYSMPLQQGGTKNGQCSPSHRIFSPNQFVDQGYNEFSGDESPKNVVLYSGQQTPKTFNKPNNTSSVAPNTRIIPIAFESNNGGPMHTVVIQRDPRMKNTSCGESSTPTQSKSFKVLQKITDTSNDSVKEIRAVESDNGNMEPQLHQPTYARQMSSSLQNNNPGTPPATKPSQRQFVQRPMLNLHEQHQHFVHQNANQIPASPNYNFKMLEAMTQAENAAENENSKVIESHKLINEYENDCAYPCLYPHGIPPCYYSRNSSNHVYANNLQCIPCTCQTQLKQQEQNLHTHSSQHAHHHHSHQHPCCCCYVPMPSEHNSQNSDCCFKERGRIQPQNLPNIIITSNTGDQFAPDTVENNVKEISRRISNPNETEFEQERDMDVKCNLKRYTTQNKLAHIESKTSLNTKFEDDLTSSSSSSDNSTTSSSEDCAEQVHINGLPINKSVTNIQVYNRKPSLDEEDEDDQTNYDEESTVFDEEEEVFKDEELEYEEEDLFYDYTNSEGEEQEIFEEDADLSVIYEENEPEPRPSSLISYSVSETSTLEQSKSKDEDDEVLAKDEDNDENSNSVTVRLPLKFSFSRSVNDESVATIEVGNSQIDNKEKSLSVAYVEPDCDNCDTDPYDCDVSVTINLSHCSKSEECNGTVSSPVSDLVDGSGKKKYFWDSEEEDVSELSDSPICNVDCDENVSNTFNIMLPNKNENASEDEANKEWDYVSEFTFSNDEEYNFPKKPIFSTEEESMDKSAEEDHIFEISDKFTIPDKSEDTKEKMSSSVDRRETHFADAVLESSSHYVDEDIKKETKEEEEVDFWATLQATRSEAKLFLQKTAGFWGNSVDAKDESTDINVTEEQDKVKNISNETRVEVGRVSENNDATSNMTTNNIAPISRKSREPEDSKNIEEKLTNDETFNVKRGDNKPTYKSITEQEIITSIKAFNKNEYVRKKLILEQAEHKTQILKPKFLKALPVHEKPVPLKAVLSEVEIELKSETIKVEQNPNSDGDLSINHKTSIQNTETPLEKLEEVQKPKKKTLKPKSSEEDKTKKKEKTKKDGSVKQKKVKTPKQVETNEIDVEKNNPKRTELKLSKNVMNGEHGQSSEERSTRDNETTDFWVDRNYNKENENLAASQVPKRIQESGFKTPSASKSSKTEENTVLNTESKPVEITTKLSKLSLHNQKSNIPNEIISIKKQNKSSMESLQESNELLKRKERRNALKDQLATLSWSNVDKFKSQHAISSDVRIDSPSNAYIDFWTEKLPSLVKMPNNTNDEYEGNGNDSRLRIVRQQKISETDSELSHLGSKSSSGIQGKTKEPKEKTRKKLLRSEKSSSLINDDLPKLSKKSKKDRSESSSKSTTDQLVEKIKDSTVLKDSTKTKLKSIKKTLNPVKQQHANVSCNSRLYDDFDIELIHFDPEPTFYAVQNELETIHILTAEKSTLDEDSEEENFDFRVLKKRFEEKAAIALETTPSASTEKETEEIDFWAEIKGSNTEDDEEDAARSRLESDFDRDSFKKARAFFSNSITVSPSKKTEVIAIPKTDDSYQNVLPVLAAESFVSVEPDNVSGRTFFKKELSVPKNDVRNIVNERFVSVEPDNVTDRTFFKKELSTPKTEVWNIKSERTFEPDNVSDRTFFKKELSIPQNDVRNIISESFVSVEPEKMASTPKNKVRNISGRFMSVEPDNVSDRTFFKKELSTPQIEARKNIDESFVSAEPDNFGSRSFFKKDLSTPKNEVRDINNVSDRTFFKNERSTPINEVRNIMSERLVSLEPDNVSDRGFFRKELSTPNNNVSDRTFFKKELSTPNNNVSDSTFFKKELPLPKNDVRNIISEKQPTENCKQAKQADPEIQLDKSDNITLTVPNQFRPKLSYKGSSSKQNRKSVEQTFDSTSISEETKTSAKDRISASEEPSKTSVKDRISAFENVSNEQHVDNSNTSLLNESLTPMSSLSRNSSQRSESEVEEDDSGVTDMNKPLSETDTESECFPELRKMTRYQRASTHSRLFKLLQTSDDIIEEEKSCEENDLEAEFNFRKPKKIVHNVSITRRQNPQALQQAETLTQRRQRLSLPLQQNHSIDADNPSSPNSPASPIYERQASNVTNKLVNELVQSLLLKKSSISLKNLPMEKLQAAAKRVLEEELDSLENTSLDSTPALTPQDLRNPTYADYYDSWKSKSDSVNPDDKSFEILPSKAFKALQETTSSAKKKSWAVMCPRIRSSKTVNRDLARVTESPEIVSRSSPEITSRRSGSLSRWTKT